ncbi:MAG: FAD-dependent oxidoreductase [Methylococcales bacterium]|nr:FAD-dependent oxidoreductase [Methylococcales bacterium]MBT7444535.1 FAD-dependent oxidoreductase [Methylococcales bacterium]
MAQSQPKCITVIGAGFAGLTAIRTLRKQDSSAIINIIHPTSDFIYFPSLIWIPCKLREPKDLLISLTQFFTRMNVNHIQASVTGISDDGKTIHTTAGDVEQDGIIVASGGRFIKKLPGINNAITPCEGIPAAMKIRERLANMTGGTIAIGFSGNPKEPSAMRGGPMFEFLFGIDTQLRREGRRDKFKLVFFCPAKKPGARLGEKAVEGLLSTMKDRNIETHLGHKMTRIEPYKVVTEGGEIDADLILFMPGMTGNLWFDQSPLTRSEGGLVKADKFCQVDGFKHIFVAGDSGSFPGPEWLPKQAHMADLQAVAAAKNLLATLSGGTPSETFKAELMCIVDSQNKGMMVSRTMKGSKMLPPSIFMHWAKRFFEWAYLIKYR